VKFDLLLSRIQLVPLHDGRTIRLPIHLCQLMQKSKGAAKELALELGRSPDDDELAGRLGVTRRGAVQAESSAPVA
jgi:DNA-directed RNA polymerase sigma subunit (sigma70/sigma32)